MTTVLLKAIRHNKPFSFETSKEKRNRIIILYEPFPTAMMVFRCIKLSVLLLTFFLAMECAKIGNAKVISGHTIATSLLGQPIQLRSKNLKNHYIRHRNFELWVDPYSDTELYQLDSTFYPVIGFSGHGVSLRSENYYTRYIRHKGRVCFINPPDGSALYAKDASWIVRPGLADKNGISFESVNFPHYFLRHKHYRVRIDKNDGSQLFRDDATYYVESPQY